MNSLIKLISLASSSLISLNVGLQFANGQEVTQSESGDFK
jgi:hypothetical protein